MNKEGRIEGREGLKGVEERSTTAYLCKGL